MQSYRIICYRVLREIKGEKYWSYPPSPFKFSSCIRHIVVKKGEETLMTSVGEVTSINVTRGDGGMGWSRSPGLDLGDFKLDDPWKDFEFATPVDFKSPYEIRVDKPRLRDTGDDTIYVIDFSSLRPS